MNMKKLNLAAVLFLVILTTGLFAQISGTVFRDFNANGIKENITDFDENGMAGVTVIAYSSSGAIVGTTTSSATGSWSLPAVTSFPVRVEFSGYPTDTYSGPNGTSNTSSVQFISATSTSVNFGLQVGECYMSTLNPQVATTLFRSGDPILNATAGSRNAVPIFNFNNGSITSFTSALASDVNWWGSVGTAPTPTVGALASQVGSCWGIAHHKGTRNIITSSFLRRHVGLGPNGLGAIYKVPDNGSSTASLLVDLVALGVNLGTIPSNSVRGLSSPTTPTHDVEAFDKVGKIGLGDIDISSDEKYLFTVNLFEKKLIRINLTPTLTAPTGGDISQFNIPNPGCINGQVRPWALKYYLGKLYVGVTCDGSTGSSSDLSLHVYAFDVATSTWSASPVFTLNSPLRPIAQGNWNNWNNTFVQGPDFNTNPQPLLSDIDFDNNGDMILGVLDVYGIKTGHDNYRNVTTDFGLYDVIIFGDILRATKSGSTWTNNVGSGGVEYYGNDNGVSNGSFPNLSIQSDACAGGISSVCGLTKVMMSATDPAGAITNGVIVLNNTTGVHTSRYTIMSTMGPTGSSVSENQGKGIGIGDIELLTPPPPIEIGNRIWLDTDSDGVQDPNESPIVGVTVQLVNSSGTVIATAVTNSSGNYYFTNATGTNTSSSIYNITQLQANMTYTVRIPNINGGSKQSALANYRLTTQNANNGIPATQEDVRDSDGAIVGTSAEALVLTTQIPVSGANNHTFDFGFFACAPNYHEICNDGSDTLTLTADAGLTNVMWYDSTTNTLIGSGISIKITSSTLGLSDTYEAYYYTALDATGCTVSLCCPVQVKTIPCCQISVQNTSTLCNNNSTLAISTDDWFSLTLSATVTGGSGNYIVKIGAYTSASTASGSPITITGNGAGGNPLLQANGTATYTVTVQDATNGSCLTTFSIGPVAACSSCPNPNCFTIGVQKN